MAKSDSPLVVLQSFIGRIGGADTHFRQGESIDSAHPAVKKWPAFFGQPIIRHEVEQATAAPGEQRGHALTTADLEPKRGK
jgi:hypothetical protein